MKFGQFFSSHLYRRAWPFCEAYENLSKMLIVRDTEIKREREIQKEVSSGNTKGDEDMKMRWNILPH